jgi:hypothetical protein
VLPPLVPDDELLELEDEDELVVDELLDVVLLDDEELLDEDELLDDCVPPQATRLMTDAAKQLLYSIFTGTPIIMS